MEDSSHSPSKGLNTFSNVLAILGCMVIFVVIVAVAYLSKLPADVGAEDAAFRLARLKEIKSKAEEGLNSYAVIDKSKGTVRLPLERAIQLTAERLQTKGK